MLSQLSSPPQYITAEAHDNLTSSTPSSFTDIPPVLRFEDGDVQVEMSPITGWEGWNGRVNGQLWVTEAYVYTSIWPAIMSHPTFGFTWIVLM